MDIEQHLPDSIRRHYLRKFALIVLVIAVLVTGVGVLTQIEAANQVQDNRQGELRNIAGSEAAQLAAWRDSQRERAGLLSENDEFEDVDNQAELQTALNNQAERFPESLYAIHYVRGVEWRSNNSVLANATINASTVSAREGESLAVSGMKWRNGFSFADNNAIDESKVYATNGQELIAFASPVENRDVVAVAVFDATERGARFRDRIAGGYTQVVDADGEVQFAADRNEILSQYDGALSAGELQQARAGQSNVVERGGEIISYASVARTGWVLVKHVPQANAYRLSQLVTDRLFVLIGMTLLGFATLGGILSRGTIARLDDLSGDASRLADGDLERTITETNRIDEIGEVQHAFQDIQSYMQTIAEQADAIANREFEAAVLDDEVPGDIGTALEEMRRDLATSIRKLEQSNENLQEFAYIASHDLQEPLRSVTSYLNLIETEYGDKLDEDGQFYIERAENNASRMSSMIDALLQYSRVKSQGGEFVTVDATETVSETVDSLGVLIEETEAEVEYDALPTVTADRDQLRQLFQNLIKNAIEHGGSPPRVEIQGEDIGGAWQFSVGDNGPGIPKAQQDRIFEIFQQATDDGDDSGESGIGLAICERIASRHQGDIWVDSDDGGSTFKFTIDKAIE